MARRATAVSRGQKSESQGDTSLEELLQLIQRAKGDGITLSEIQQGIGASVPALKRMLKTLAQEGAIDAPIKHGTPKREYYFAAGLGPSIDGVSAKLVRLVGQAGASRKQLEKEITGIESALFKDAILRAAGSGKIRGPYGKERFYLPIGGPTAESVCEKLVLLAKKAGTRPPSEKILKKELRGSDLFFLTDAIALAVRSDAVLALDCGGTMFYLHGGVARQPSREESRQEVRAAVAELALEDILPAYRRIKIRQSGRSTVKIFDLLQELRDLEVPKEAVHKLLIEEGRKGRISNHHASVPLPQDVVAAGFRLAGFEEPFVTFTIRSEQ